MSGTDWWTSRIFLLEIKGDRCYGIIVNRCDLLVLQSAIMQYRNLFPAIVACFWVAPGLVCGQMVTTQSPLQHQSSSFYEYSHVGWGVHNPHYFMNFNGGGALPPFGGYQPNAGLQGGLAVGNSHLNFGFGQGASYTSTTTTPVLTTTNGFPGYLFIGTERPFVTGVTPVVGSGFASVPPMGPLAARVATGELRLDGGRIMPRTSDVTDLPQAPRGADAAMPVAAGEAARPMRPKREASSAVLSPAQYLERAITAEKEGRGGVARIYYQLAATNGDAVVKAEATRRLDGLKAR